MKEMEMMIGGAVGIEREYDYLKIHTRISMHSGPGKIMVRKIRALRGVVGIGGAPSDRYGISIHIGDLFTVEEILPHIKATIARYAPREYI